MAFDPNCTRAVMAAGSMMQSHHDYDVALVSYTIPYYDHYFNYLRGYLYFRTSRFFLQAATSEV